MARGFVAASDAMSAGAVKLDVRGGWWYRFVGPTLFVLCFLHAQQHGESLLAGVCAQSTAVQTASQQAAAMLFTWV